MSHEIRTETALDRIISLLDHALKSATGCPPASGRAAPAPRGPALEDLASPTERRHAAGLMRVNHAGEVAAQALYHGQALVARDPSVREFLLQAAREEGDHLNWCEQRLRQLGSRPSILGPLWYVGSVAIGAGAGIAGDSVSLGFIAETEKQVEGHIDDQLEQLPKNDVRSRTILEQMKTDETTHRLHALDRGGAELPGPVRQLMYLTSKIMTKSAYRL